MRLKPARKRIVILLALVFVIMGLFPPWKQRVNTDRVRWERPAGYHLIFEPPSVGHSAIGVELDLARLAIQWVVLAAAAGVLILLISGKDKQ